MKKTILAALIAAASVSAMASDYFVVVPVPNRSATTGNILVTLSSYGLPNAVAGDAYAGFDFNSVLQVKGDPNFTPSNVRWSVSTGALPAGLSLSSGGQLTGTPTVAGTSNFGVMAAYKTKAGQQNYAVTVNNLVVSLASASLPAGIQGAAYSYDLKPKLAITGDAAYTGQGITWSVASGSLPAGLSLGADGVISGTPTAENTGTPFTVQASYKTKAGQQAYQVVVGAIVVTLSGAALPAGIQGAAYSYDLKPKLAITGDAAYTGQGITWSVASGSLPAGLSLVADGVISGTPTAANTGTPFTVQASYKTKAGQQAYQVVVGAIVVTLNGAALPAGVQGAPYSYDLKPKLAITGDAAYAGTGVTWSVASGSLPAGLSLGADGVISGTPSAESDGSTPFTVQAAYKTSTGQQGYAVVVGAITVTLSSATSSPPGVTIGQAYNSGNGWDLKPNLSITGDNAYAGNGTNVSWSIAGGALPTGLNLNSNGTVTGTPSAKGTNPVQVKAAYKGKSATQSYTFAVTQILSQFSGYRAWSDNTYAASCNAYLNPTAGHLYSGATGNGVYRLQTGGTVTDAYCDMTSDGGGWTLAMRGLGGNITGWNTAGALNLTRSAAADASTGMTFKLADATINLVRNGGLYRLKSDGLINQTRFVAPFAYSHTTLLTQAMTGTPPTVTYATTSFTAPMRAANLSQPFYYGISDDGGQWNTYFSTNRTGGDWSLGINVLGNGNNTSQYCTGDIANCNFTMWVR